MLMIGKHKYYRNYIMIIKWIFITMIMFFNYIIINIRFCGITCFNISTCFRTLLFSIVLVSRIIIFNSTYFQNIIIFNSTCFRTLLFSTVLVSRTLLFSTVLPIIPLSFILKFLLSFLLFLFSLSSVLSVII